MIDPLPVLAFSGRSSDEDEDDESLESIANKGRKATDPEHNPADNEA